MTNASVQVAVEDAILEQLLTSGCSTLMLRDMFSVALDEQMTSVRPLHRLLYSRSNANVYFRLFKIGLTVAVSIRSLSVGLAQTLLRILRFD